MLKVCEVAEVRNERRGRGPRNRFRRDFESAPTVLARISAVWNEQTLRDVEDAFAAGCSGVLIDASSCPEHEYARLVRSVLSRPGRRRDEWVGLSGSQMSPVLLDLLSERIGGLFISYAGARSGPDRRQLADTVEAVRNYAQWDGVLISGFRLGTEELADPGAAAVNISPFVDVVSVAGSRWESNPPAACVEATRQALGGFPVAVLGAEQPGYVRTIRDSVDCLIVPFRSRPEGQVDSQELAALVAAAREGA
jgi:hypothetical protein